MTAPTPVPAVVLASEFPTNADRVAGVFNAKAVAWANSENAMVTRTREIAQTAHDNAVFVATVASSTEADKTAAAGSASAAAASALAADSSKIQAATSASQAETSRIQASKLNLGPKSTPPAKDNQGETLLAGATYYATNLSKWKVWTGTAWADGLSGVAGVSSINGMSGDVVLPASSVFLDGDTNIYITQSKTYTITNYNVFSTYSVAVSAGTASVSGSTINFTAPSSAASVTMTVTMDGEPVDFVLVVKGASVLAPTITNPISGATGVTESPTFTTAAFQWAGVADTHLNTDWELWTGANRTGTLVWSALASSDKLSKALPAGLVSVSTPYTLAVRHRGTTLGESAWSTSNYTTAATFNSYVPTPEAAPAFGAAFGGGFYAGKIWNETTQSATSTLIATGTKVFTVVDMTATPLFYSGQVVEVRSRANPANKMVGTVSGATGTSLTVTVTSVGGSGTFTDWSVMAKYNIIVAPKSSGDNASTAYKNADTAAPAATGTLTEGRKATLAMVAADNATVYPAAHWANNLNINGKTDWYLPARDELELCWRNLKPTTNNNYTTANRPAAATPNYQNLGSYGGTEATHGLNKNSDPSGAAYTATVPAQTTAAAFKTGGAEAFEFGSSYYWSSTEYNATTAWFQYFFTGSEGFQGYSSKTAAYRARAARRQVA